MLLIAGLGNPGKQYQKTRHNAGFMALDYFKKANSLPDFNLEKKFLAEISEGKIGGEKVILAKPQTFMNNSGKAVGLLAKYFKIKPENILVSHDDADLPLGAIKIVKNRGSAGHKGVESIMRALKSRDFIRFRIGTRTTKSLKIPSRSKKIMGEFVLGKFSGAQEELLKKTIRGCRQAIEETIKDGVAMAMNKFN